MKHHDLKCDPIYFEQVDEGRKTFEVRVNDRNFESGDSLQLFEYDRRKMFNSQTTGDLTTVIGYTGKKSRLFQIGFILNLDKYAGAEKNLVVLSLI